MSADGKIISADSHFSEPADLWINYIDPEFRARAPHVEHQEHADVFVCDTGEMLPIGILHGIRYKGGVAKNEGRYSEVPASSWDPHARIPELNLDGVYGEVLYPTIAMRFYTITDVPFEAACIRAYNRWASDFCKSYPDRFKAVGLVMLDDLGQGVDQLRECKELGLAAAMLPVYPDGAAPYYESSYDSLWEAAQDMNMPISLHLATERRVIRPRNATEQFLRYNVIQQVFIGMIYTGVFDRFPSLQVVSVENDAGWAGNIIERMDYYHAEAPVKGILGTDRVNKKNPSEYWRSNVSYTFMRDLAAIQTRSIIGVDRLMWASDFPHSDSTWPESRQVIDRHMVGVPEREASLIQGGNAARLYGF